MSDERHDELPPSQRPEEVVQSLREIMVALEQLRTSLAYLSHTLRHLEGAEDFVEDMRRQIPPPLTGLSGEEAG